MDSIFETLESLYELESIRRHVPTRYCPAKQELNKADSQQIVFRPEIYEVETLEQAKRITVTAEEGTTTEDRGQKETAYLTKEIGRRLELEADDCVFDYGCGTGRVSKTLIVG